MFNPEQITIHNATDEEGRPAGGIAYATGFSISWQNGPLGRGDERQEPNGAFVENVIYACIHRLRFYNEAGFECKENIEAIDYLSAALDSLNQRTRRREAVGIEGTHEGT